MPAAFGDLRVLATRATVVVAVAAGIAACGFFVVRTADALLLIFAGLLFAVLLSAAADTMARLSGMQRAVALTITLITLAAGFVATAVALWPSLSAQIDQLATDLPVAVAELQQWIAQQEWGRWLLGRAEPDRLVRETGFIDQATGAFMSTLSAVAGMVVILFVVVPFSRSRRLRFSR